MNKRKVNINKTIFIFMFLMLVIIPQNVKADIRSDFVCSDQGYKVLVDYNDKYVSLTDAHKESNMNLGYVEGHIGDKNYRILSNKTDFKCTNIGQKINVVCPSKKTRSYFDNKGKYSKDNLIKNGLVKIDYNFDKETFDVYFSKEIINNFYVRLVPNNTENNDIYSKNPGLNIKTFYPDNQYMYVNSAFGYHFTVKPNKPIIVEYYDKTNNECNFLPINNQAFVTMPISELVTKNPAVYNKNNENYKFCKENIINNKNYPNDSTSKTIKESVAYLCYKKEINGKEYHNLTSYIRNAKNKLDEMFKNINLNNNKKEPDNIILSDKNKNRCSPGNGQTKCQESTNGSEQFYAYSNSNFAVVCTDKYEFHGDTPKLVPAGSGFEYGSKLGYKLTRTCEIKFIGSPAVKQLQCTGWHCDMPISSWDIKGNKRETEVGDAGPNEKFDSCILKCDGGDYSQSCINKCYTDVYGKKNKRNNKLDRDIRKNYKGRKVEVIKFQNVPIEVPSGWTIQDGGPSTTDHNRAGRNIILIDPQGHVHSYINLDISNYCQTHNGSVVVNCYPVPSGCIWNAEEVYHGDLSSIYGDYSSALNALTMELQPGNVTLNIVDSYLKNQDGTFFTFNINDKNSDIKVKKYTRSGGGVGTCGSAMIGASGPSRYGMPDNIPLHSYAQAIEVNGIGIDATSYVGKVYGNIVYNKDNRTYQIAKQKNKNYDIIPFNDFNKDNFYYNNMVIDKDNNINYGKYYTSLYSTNMNVTGTTNDIKLNKDCYNIEVSVNGVGNSQNSHNFSNSCYYGVYNNFIDMNHKNPENKGNGKIRYIFRPIDLTDVFPKRPPRWNWTNNASLNLKGPDPYLHYNVNPIRTTEEIENKGNTILAEENHELDYEIILDKGSIYRIKRYNKDMKGYTNFSLNCREKGVYLCKSKFLDNADYIKNAGNVRVKAKIGTNND